MSLTIAMNTALSGLQVMQKALEITSNNVSNANTEGYSRKIPNFETLTVDGEASGVDIGSITRTVDEFLLREIRGEISEHTRLETLNGYFQRMQDLFGSLGSDSAMSDRMADLAAKLDALTINPESASARLEVVDAAQALARQINNMSDQTQLLRQDTENQIDIAVDQVNIQLKRIASINKQIAENIALDRPTGDLEDQRDIALNDLAKEIDISYFKKDTGEIVVYTRSGQVLVDTQAATMTYDPTSPVSVGSTFNDIKVNNVAITTDIKSGRIAAMIDMRDNTLSDFQKHLDELTEHLRDEVNKAHNRGTGLPAPNSLIGTRTFADITVDQVTLADKVRLATINSTGVIQAYYDVPAGTYTIEALRDLINTNFGASVTATAGNAAAFSISADNAALGISIVDLPATGNDTTVTYNDGSGNKTFQGFSNFFSLNDFFQTGTNVAGGSTSGISGLLTVSSRIVADPTLLARGRLYNSTTTLPVAGTTTGVAIGDNVASKMMAEAFGQSVSFDAVGGLPAMTTTVIDFATQILSFNSTKSAAAKQDLDIKKALLDEFKNKATSISGVNVDEEMANLILYQNAYSASARVITVTDEMLETLLSII